MKSALRWLLWKLLRRDFLVLNPAMAVITRTADSALLGRNAAACRRLLAVSYNYHTLRAWRLHYRMHGQTRGTLRGRWSAPGKDPFCAWESAVQLPATWTVQREGDALRINGHPMPLLPGRILPADTSWLVGEFALETDGGETWTRRTGHRIRCEPLEVTSDYFTGAVYEDYEQQAAAFPRQVIEAIARHHPLRGRLLDVGCATGLLVGHALARGLEAEGIDVSPWAVDRANARTRGRCRVLNFDQATTHNFPAAYDIITLHSVLEHLADPARALALVFDLCVPGGVVFIETLNADSLMHRLQGDDWGGFSDPTHQSPELTADWLVETATRIGFEVRSLKRYGVWNDNLHDDVWRAFASFVQLHPAGVLLEERFGDFVELILRRPECRQAS